MNPSSVAETQVPSNPAIVHPQVRLRNRDSSGYPRYSRVVLNADARQFGCGACQRDPRADVMREGGVEDMKRPMRKADPTSPRAWSVVIENAVGDG